MGLWCPCAECGLRSTAGSSGAGCCSAGTHGAQCPQRQHGALCRAISAVWGGDVTWDKGRAEAQGGEDGGSGGSEENAAALPERDPRMAWAKGRRAAAAKLHTQLCRTAAAGRCGDAWRCDRRRKHSQTLRRGMHGAQQHRRAPLCYREGRVRQRRHEGNAALVTCCHFPCKQLLPLHPGSRLTQAVQAGPGAASLQPAAGLAVSRSRRHRQPNPSTQ